MDRKQLLHDIIPEDSSLVSKVKFLEGHGSTYFDLVRQQGLEGIVLKRKDSLYEVGKRSWVWLKVINYQYDDVVITGLRKGKFGLLLGFQGQTSRSNGENILPAERKKLYGVLEVVSDDDKFTFIEHIPCRVRYRNLTRTGLLRLPPFVKWNKKNFRMEL